MTQLTIESDDDPCLLVGGWQCIGGKMYIVSEVVHECVGGKHRATYTLTDMKTFLDESMIKKGCSISVDGYHNGIHVMHKGPMNICKGESCTMDIDPTFKLLRDESGDEKSVIGTITMDNIKVEVK